VHNKKTENNFLLYDVTATCFGFYRAILRQASKQEFTDLPEDGYVEAETRRRYIMK
jgi:hypothetical protein